MKDMVKVHFLRTDRKNVFNSNHKIFILNTYRHAEEIWHSDKKYAFIRKSAIFTQYGVEIADFLIKTCFLSACQFSSASL